ncbi:MAG TPA: hypothetical protein VMR97_14580 [Acidimicrobiales bacterium]|nr:hypothetical protein [Acidimicrobiales bacterium]
MSATKRIIVKSGAAGTAAALTAAALLAFTGGTASAKSGTLRFFSKSVTSSFYTANGQPITNQNTQPAVGDYLISSDLDYVGNHKSHAKSYTATDNLVCTISVSTSTSIMGICDGAIAMGGSMLLASHETVNFAATSPVVPINGGVGQFNGAHGTVKTVQVGNTNNSDITVSYTT